MNNPNREQLVAIYRHARTIAVVGASTNEEKPAHKIPAYLKDQGFRVIPVNPTAEAIFGEPTVAMLTHITGAVDVVDVFRPAAETPEIARQAAGIGASVLWLQLGIESQEAAEIARSHGMKVVMDQCIGATHERLKREGEL